MNKMVKESITSRDAIKKQRKKSSTANDANKLDEDAYKKIVDFEESEAAKRTPDKDAELYFQTCQNIREQLTEISKLKEKNTPEAKAKVAGKRVETCMLVAMLKKLNRLEKFRTKSGRDLLHQEKLHADSTKLQLQNLLYELSYLKKEIAKCFQFRSLDEEIDLISEEEFFQHAPESISRPSTTKKDQHLLQLARLEWELQQRKQLASQCQKLEAEKEQVAAQIINKQERLDKLAPQLNNILEVIKPLQEQLGITAEKVREEHHLAYLLPNPLYLLYAKVIAFTQVYDKNTLVHILGEEEEAKQMKKDDTESQYSTNDSDSDQDISEESQERQKRHHRKSSRITESQEGKRNKLLASHPLYIQITINLKKEKASLVLDFYYKVKLHIITVKCKVTTNPPIGGITVGEILSSENILQELFSNDNGKESPNPTNHYQLQQLQLGNFSSLIDQLGHAYIWAQQICGLDFISFKAGSASPIVNIELSQTSVESVMKLLRERFRSRIFLAMQIQELEKNIIPAVPDVYNVPLKINGTISSWQKITWQEYAECKNTEKLISEQYVNNVDMFYRLVIDRKSANLIALVAIKNNFPQDKSLFTITINWNGEKNSNNCDTVRDIEKAVNSDWSSDIRSSDKVLLLSAQIRRLISCFDIYLEIESQEVFEREKIFFSSTRGRNRRHPYKYLKVGGGIFTQY